MFSYTYKFDGFDSNPSNIQVTESEIQAAYASVDPNLVRIIQDAIKNITTYHQKQVRNSWIDTNDGILLGQKITPIERVGVYVTGGQAVYPSCVLMNVVTS